MNLLPNLPVTNLCKEKANYAAHCVFSTYQTMMNFIDAVRGRLPERISSTGLNEWAFNPDNLWELSQMTPIHQERFCCRMLDLAKKEGRDCT